MSSCRFLQILITLLFCLLIPFKIEGAILYLDSSQEEYRQDQTFMVNLRIDIEGECINTVKADLGFPQDVLEAIDFSQGNSILSLWLKPADINQSLGLISFIGGVPGGYCGRLPGDLGLSNLLGKIIFKVKEKVGVEPFSAESQARVEFLDSSQVLLNDGFGTPAELTNKGITLKILPKSVEIPAEDEWQKELEKDIIPPEPFQIEINKDPSIFEGKYFAVFSTLDKQTGIDHYEIQEIPPKWMLKSTKFEKAESPYLLQDQSLKSIIKVKAVDKAGNERIAEYLPPKKPFPSWIIILILLILIGSGFGFWFYRKLKLR